MKARTDRTWLVVPMDGSFSNGNMYLSDAFYMKHRRKDTIFTIRVLLGNCNKSMMIHGYMSVAPIP
jgi:hypothetical protein